MRSYEKCGHIVGMSQYSQSNPGLLLMDVFLQDQYVEINYCLSFGH